METGKESEEKEYFPCDFPGRVTTGEKEHRTPLWDTFGLLTQTLIVKYRELEMRICRRIIRWALYMQKCFCLFVGQCNSSSILGSLKRNTNNSQCCLYTFFFFPIGRWSISILVSISIWFQRRPIWKFFKKKKLNWTYSSGTYSFYIFMCFIFWNNYFKTWLKYNEFD